MKKLKKILVMFMTVILIGGSVPASASSENVTDLKLTNVQTVEMEDGLSAVIEDYTSLPNTFARSTVHTISKVRKYYIKNTSTDEVYVSFYLHGEFKYDGKTSACTKAYLNVYNDASDKFSVQSKKCGKSGIWANADCAVKQIKNGKIWKKTLKIGVKPDGTVLMQ